MQYAGELQLPEMFQIQPQRATREVELGRNPYNLG